MEDRRMNSGATIDMVNAKKFREVIAKLDPELYLIKVALDETGLNPRILPRFIRALSNLAYGTGYGKVQVFMQQHIVTAIMPEESDRLDLPALDKVE